MAAACAVLAMLAFHVLLPAPVNAQSRSGEAANRSRPNLLLIVADDMGYADAGFQGSREIETPNLDRLADSGIRFSNAYVSAPQCAPARAGLLTGRYQTRFGFESNRTAEQHGLDLTQRTLADHLRDAGYRTGLVGKWHLGVTSDMHPQRRGFDEFFGFLGGHHGYHESGGILRGTDPAEAGEYLTDAFGREAADFIRRHESGPWFLYLAFNAPHTPMEATERDLVRYEGLVDPKRRTYAAMMLALDKAVGRVMDALDATHARGNTLVVFISDNGGATMPGTTTNAAVNLPLRGSKRTTLEGGIRVPFVLSWPEKLGAGEFHEPIIQLDVLPTFLAAAGAAVAPDTFDGVDLLPYLNGKAQGVPHAALYWRFWEQMAVRQGDYKLVRYDRAVDTGVASSNREVTPPRLYRLSDDPGEQHDLAAGMPGKVEALQALWDRWNLGNAPPSAERPGAGE